MDFLRQIFGSGNYMPHGFCYLWNARLVWLHVVSDSLIALSYFAIPAVLLWFVRKRRDLPFNWMFVLFGVFIVACGFTHVMEVWNLWHANYWLAGGIKAITAAASVCTAILLTNLMPAVLALPGVEQLIRDKSDLEQKVSDVRDEEMRSLIREAGYRDQAALLDITHDAIFVRDMRAKITYWNRGAEVLYGWNRDEAAGKVSHELLTTIFPKPLTEIESDVFLYGSWEGELIHTKRDGSKIVVASRWAVQTDAWGKPEAFLESNRDITVRKRLQKRFEDLIETAPDAMVIVDDGGRIALVNAQTERLFGYARGELIGKTVETLIPDRFRSAHAVHRGGYTRSPHARAMGVGLELHGLRKDGDEFPVEISLSPLETDEGTLVCAAIRDVSERRQAQQALRESEERLKLALESAQMGAWDLDLIHDTTIRSPRHDEIFGYSAPLASWGVADFAKCVLPEDKENAFAAIAEARRTGHFEMEARVIRPDHSLAWISAQGRVYRNDSGEPIRMVGVISDVSDRKLLEKILEEQRKELKRSNSELTFLNKELETFSYSVSHDLRAPLRHIDGFARILLDEYSAELPPEAARYLGRVVEAANRMGALIDDLLSLSRIGRKELTLRPTNLDAVVKQAMADLPPGTENSGIEWKIEPLGEAVCDASLVKLVFTNLLSNAVKFTRTRRPAVIEVGTLPANGTCAYFIRDNGVGFDPQYADKLFGVFQRLHSQQDFEGTGVGLATVRRIVQRHGGEIWAESQLGQGATFSFTLSAGPLASAAQEAPKEPEVVASDGHRTRGDSAC